MDAQQRRDIDAVVTLLGDDVRMTLFPAGVNWDGHDAVAGEHLRQNAESHGTIRSVAVATNRQPAIAVYIRTPGDTEYRAWAVVLLGVLDGKPQATSPSFSFGG